MIKENNICLEERGSRIEILSIVTTTQEKNNKEKKKREKRHKNKEKIENDPIRIKTDPIRKNFIHSFKTTNLERKAKSLFVLTSFISFRIFNFISLQQPWGFCLAKLQLLS